MHLKYIDDSALNIWDWSLWRMSIVYLNENLFNNQHITVKPRPEAHMDLILFEVFLKSIDLIPQQQILQRHYLYYK